jgi:hypothetical protein
LSCSGLGEGGTQASRRRTCAICATLIHPSKGPAHKGQEGKKFQSEVIEIVPKPKPEGDNWHPGNAPSQVVKWAVESLAKAGTLSIIGVYPEAMQTFPLGNFMEKNMTMRAGNCNHRKYIPKLVDLVRMGQVNPAEVLTQTEPIISAIEAYKLFDRRTTSTPTASIALSTPMPLVRSRIVSIGSSELKSMASAPCSVAICKRPAIVSTAKIRPAPINLQLAIANCPTGPQASL